MKLKNLLKAIENEKTNIFRLRYYRTFWALITLLGISLIVFMVKVESEPGLLPLGMTLTGITGFIYIQFKIKNANKLKQES